MDGYDLCDFMMTFLKEQEVLRKRDTDAAENLFRRGKELLEARQLVEAQECFEEAITLDPSNREAYRLHEELKLRLGPSRNEDATIFVRDPHKQLGTLILRAGECHSWFRREVTGVYDLAMYLSTERGTINWEYHRVAAIVICVFTHEYEIAKIQLAKIAQKIRKLWRMDAKINPVGGTELPPYFEVVLRPEYETQEIERLVKEQGPHSDLLIDLDKEQERG